MHKQVCLHKILQHLMAIKKLSAKSLSATTGVPASTLSTYLCGAKASYNPKHLAALADQFDVSIDFLLYGPTVRKLSGQELSVGTFDGRIEVIVRRLE
jgi:transcriptional regulator with XRE-family HTH domain